MRIPRLADISSKSADRIDTGIRELNRVLGGGIVKGSLVLISGEPGIGKSTIIVQTASNIARKYGAVVYVSGEESEEQIKIRADRVCRDIPDELLILSETNMDSIVDICTDLTPDLLIIDSIQTMYTEDLDSAPGSVSQVRACGNELMRLCKGQNIPVFIVAHVTKSGELAGPRSVEHMVDCVLNFSGERHHELRILRAQKNRFGTTSEIGAFEMGEQGLLEIGNLSGMLLEEMDGLAEGAVATAVYEGTRPLILEVQALTAPSVAGFARRSSVGTDNVRLSMILAVLEKQMGLHLKDKDVYVNIVGGIKPQGTYTDLAVASAVYSSYCRRSLDGKSLITGEVGLTGDMRGIRNGDKIIKEAERLGFERMIIPVKNAERLKGLTDEINRRRRGKGLGGIQVVGIKHIREIERLFRAH